MKDIYIDLEWYQNGKIFLLSYAYNLSKYGQLYGTKLNREEIKKLLVDVENIFVYGPDIARMENYYDLNLKQNYYCFNLLTVARKYVYYAENYKLSTMEDIYGISRTENYKTNIWDLYSDFNNPKKHKAALKYNMEDSLNLVRVKRAIFKEFGITRKELMEFEMKKT